MKSSSPSIFFIFLPFLLVLFWGSAVIAEEFDIDDYEIFYGDFDSDGYAQDVFIYGKENFVLLHGEISIPLRVPGAEGGLFRQIDHYRYQEQPSEGMRPRDYDAGMAVLGKDYIAGDLNLDGTHEIVIRGRSDSGALIVSVVNGRLKMMMSSDELGYVYQYDSQSLSEQSVFYANLSSERTALSIEKGLLYVDGRPYAIDANEAVAVGEKPSENPSQPPVAVLANPAVPASIINQSDQVAAAAGAFKVTEQGDATYSVPIKVAQGTAGVSPTITLNYSSGAGTGHLGLGWSVGGIGSVSRCRQTLQIDGKIKPISFSAEDRFCLNGQRLLLVSSDKAYGEDGAQYKSEVDNYELVTSVGGTRANPDYFVVEGKDGSRTYYGAEGAHASEQVPFDDSENPISDRVVAWGEARFEDNLGNRIVYQYENTPLTHRLSEVRFAFGSAAQDDGYSARVLFEFDETAMPANYAVGYRFANQGLLQAVHSYGGRDELLRTYKIEYDQHVATGHHRIIKIRECVDEANCLKPTEFEWGEEGSISFGSNSDLVSRINLEFHADDFISYTYGDFNGDGLLDAAYVQAKRNSSTSKYADAVLRYAYQAEDGSFKLQPWHGVNDARYVYEDNPYSGDVVKLSPLDINADGRTDLAVYRSKTEAWELFLATPNANGTGWQLKNEPAFTFPFTNSNVLFQDFNGDGVVDAGTDDGVYMAVEADTAVNLPYRFVLGSDGQITNQHGYLIDFDGSRAAAGARYSLPVADFNGDGLLDFVGVKRTFDQRATGEPCYYTETWVVLLQSTSENRRYFEFDSPIVVERRKKTYSHERGICPTLSQDVKTGAVKVADINGDGNVDIVKGFYYHPSTGNKAGFQAPHYFLGKGDGSFTDKRHIDITTPKDVSWGIYYDLVDWDGDGRLDFVWMPDNWEDTSSIKVLPWEGSEFGEEIVLVDGESTRASNEFFDINSDGVADRVRRSGSSLHTYVRDDYRKSQRVDRIENNLGVSTYIRYELQNKSKHYFEQNALNMSLSSDLSVGVSAFGRNAIFSWDAPEISLEEYYSQFYSDPFQGAGYENSLLPNRVAPILHLNVPRPIVTVVSTDSPAYLRPDAKLSVAYFYSDAKLQAAGRGNLGFKQVASLDMQTGIRTVTDYRQDWPFIGRPISTKVYTKEGNLLKDSRNRYDLWGISPEPGAAGMTLDDARQLFLTGSKGLGPVKVNLVDITEMEYQLKADGEVQGPQSVRSHQSYVFDEHGNATKIHERVYEGEDDAPYSEVVTESEFGNDEWSRRFGRLSRTTVSKTIADRPTVTRSSEFEYVGTGSNSCQLEASFFGMLCKEVANPNDADARIEKELFYDIYGNEIYSKTTSTDGVRLSNFIEFDANGIYPVKKYALFSGKAKTSGISVADHGYSAEASAIGAAVQVVEHVVARNKYGKVTELKSYVDIDSAVTKRSWFTPFGVNYFSSDSTGAFQETLASFSNLENCSSTAVYSVTTREAGGKQSKACFDQLGREVTSLVSGFAGGSWIRSNQFYNELGYVSRKTLPSFVSDPSAGVTRYQYDLLNRVTKIVHPFYEIDEDGQATATKATSHIGYEGTRTTTTGPNGVTKTEEKDVLGNVVAVEESTGIIRYHYNSHGSLASMIDPAGNSTVIEYDRMGNKEKMSDPDKGIWHYRYNAFGELVCQQNAENQITQQFYDFAGRMINRKDREAGGSCDTGASGKVTTDTYWQYDVASNGLGQVARESIPDQDYQRQIGYDEFGRASVISTTVLGHMGEKITHFEKTTYDVYGRVYQKFDSARNSSSFEHNGVQYQYSATGYLSAVVDAKGGAEGKEYYRVLGMDAHGNVTSSSLNDGVIIQNRDYNPTNNSVELLETTVGLYSIQRQRMKWDHGGNLLYRKEGGIGKSSGNKGLEEHFGYDDVNRLTSYRVEAPGRPDQLTTVKYNSLGNITYKSDVDDSPYQYESAQPHAVSSARNSYQYNDNGSLISDSSGRSITYTPFDKPAQITKDSDAKVEFSYSPSRDRYKRVDTRTDGSVSKVTTTLYAGTVEKIFYPDGTREWRRNIAGVAQVVHKFDGGGKEAEKEERYLVKDHLGSINYIIARNGDVLQELAFDPWGKRRNTVTWEVLSQALVTQTYSVFNKPITSRGYTGHEMLDDVGIIHMNGRIYDPHLGRFLQADSYIQAPHSGASLNRYSYVMNNPLNATDPTGNITVLLEIFALAYIGSKDETVGQIIGIAGAVAAGFACGPLCAGAWYGTYTTMLARRNGYGASEAFHMGLMSGMQTTTMAYFSVAIGQAYGGEGGFFSFGSKNGFWHIASHATLGGVSSYMQGGKFGHGFVSAGITKGVTGRFNYSKGGWHVAGRTAIAALAGGAVSERTGGKFKNGALTAAMAHLFNAEVSGEAERAKEAALKVKVGLGSLKAEFDLLSSDKKGSLDLKERFGVEFDTEGGVKITQGDKALSLTSSELKGIEWGRKFLGVDGTAKYLGEGRFEFEGKYEFTQTRLIPFLNLELSYSSSLDVSLNGGMVNLTIKRIKAYQRRNRFYDEDL